ncbi:3829_t:CDS:1 [Racocetra persica]|uniref:3829_t:CDS:1 n=1 Tax=Racocetra persica TaxID=160502 RepID=A0ACA9MLY2_9GLOM|nr:3829_t:CDS:1 [Racocetra persica]
MYVNKVNKAAVCKLCIDKLGRDVVIKKSIFTNTKACTKIHLKKYLNFFKKYTQEERDEILYGSDNENQEVNTTSSSNSVASLLTSLSLTSTSSEQTIKTTTTSI